MKVALLIDTDWLVHEPRTLRRLVVGLIDESMRVVCVMPEAEGETAEPLSFTSEQLNYEQSGWAWLRDRNIRALGKQLAEIDVDVIHAVDGTLQPVAMQIARQLGLPCVCSVWSRQEVSRLRPTDLRINACYSTASHGLIEPVRERVGSNASITCVAPGVYGTSDEFDEPLTRPTDALSCMVIGNGMYDAYYQAMLEGIAEARADLPAAMFFFFTIDADQHRLWQAIEAMDLLEHVSLIPRGADVRQMLMRADVLLQPQPLGTVRTVVLEAMAAARPVIGLADPLVDHLVDGRSARVVEKPDAGHWATSLRQLAGGPQTFQKLGLSAREFIREHHKASAYILGIQELYRQVATPEAIPFASA